MIRACLILAGVLLLLLPADSAFAFAATRPRAGKNVLVVIIDDIDASEIHAHDPTATAATPNIDALAAAGVKFEHFYAQPICGPTRSTYIAGRYPFRTGVVTAPGTKFSEDEVTFPDVIHNNRGELVSIALFGKIGVSNGTKGPQSASNASAAYYGFRRWNGTLGPYQTDYYSYTLQQIDATGNLYADVTSWTTEASTNYLTKRTTDDFIAWLREIKARDLDRNWVGIVSYNAVHDTDENPPGYACAPNCRDEAITYLDSELARMLAEVDTSNTVVFLSGDNGITDKGTVEETSVNVRAIIGYGGIANPGTTDTGLRDISDLYQTIVDLVRGGDPPATMPDDINGTTPTNLYCGQTLVQDGESFAGIVDGATVTPRAYSWATSSGSNCTSGTAIWGGASSTAADQYKYAIDDCSRTAERFYDLSVDETDLCGGDGSCSGDLSGADLTAYNELKAELATLEASEPTCP